MFGKRFAALCSMAVMAFTFPALAGDGCSPFPRLALWGDYTHASVRKHVDEALGGDWKTYIEELQSQLTTLRKLQRRGSGVAITRDGRTVELTGDRLSQYIKHADRRLGIVRCLAARADADAIATFSTAAGTPTAVTASVRDGAVQRTFITVPGPMLDQLRQMAVRLSVKEGRKASVSDVVVDLLERELRHSRR